MIQVAIKLFVTTTWPATGFSELEGGLVPKQGSRQFQERTLGC